MARFVFLAWVVIAGLSTSGREVPQILGPIDTLQRPCGTALDGLCASLPAGVRDLALDSARNQLYVTGWGAPELVVLDGSQNQPIRGIPLGMSAHGMAFDPVLRRALVANIFNDALSIVDVDQSVVEAIVAVGDSPGWVAVNPITHHAYVSVSVSQTVSVVDVIAKSVIATIPVGGTPGEIAVDPISNTAYLAHVGASVVSVIDGATNTLRQTLQIDDPPPPGVRGFTSITLDDVRHKAYVQLAGTAHVVVIDTMTDAILDRINVPPDGEAIGMNVSANWIYLTHNPTGLTIIDGEDHQVKGTINPGRGDLRAVEVNSGTGRIFITSGGGSFLNFSGNMSGNVPMYLEVNQWYMATPLH